MNLNQTSLPNKGTTLPPGPHSALERVPISVKLGHHKISYPYNLNLNELHFFIKQKESALLKKSLFDLFEQEVVAN